MSNIEDTKDLIIARLIANTRRRKRPNNLIKIADDIVWLKDELGGLKVVSEIIGISSEMLRKFLSVSKLNSNIQKLIRERKIDSVTIAHLMSSFDNDSQNLIAKEILAGRLLADDMKVLVPLKNSMPNLSIKQLISRVIKSKNIKIYVLYFRIPNDLNNIRLLENRFKNIVAQKDIVSLTIKNQIGTLELSSAGLTKLRYEAKSHNLSLRKFVDNVLLK